MTASSYDAATQAGTTACVRLGMLPCPQQTDVCWACTAPTVQCAYGGRESNRAAPLVRDMHPRPCAVSSSPWLPHGRLSMVLTIAVHAGSNVDCNVLLSLQTAKLWTHAING